MKGLLLKNFKNIVPTIAYYAFFMVIFYVVCILSKNIIYFSSVSVVLGISVPTSSYMVDEKDNWDKFVLAAGITKNQVVRSRYLFTIMLLLALWVLSAILIFILPVGERTENVIIFLLFGGIGLVMVSFMLPLEHKYGADKSRIVLLVLVVMGVFICTFLGTMLNSGNVAIGLTVRLAVGIFVVGMAAIGISLFVTQKIYERKDF